MLSKQVTNYIKRTLASIALTALVGLVMGFAIDAYLDTKHVEVINVTGCDIKRAGSQGGDKYLVYTDNAVYQVTDNVFFLRFDSSDDYGKLKQGGMFKVEVIGWRIPFLSQYQNILDVLE